MTSGDRKVPAPRQTRQGAPARRSDRHGAGGPTPGDRSEHRGRLRHRRRRGEHRGPSRRRASGGRERAEPRCGETRRERGRGNGSPNADRTRCGPSAPGSTPRTTACRGGSFGGPAGASRIDAADYGASRDWQIRTPCRAHVGAARREVVPRRDLRLSGRASSSLDRRDASRDRYAARQVAAWLDTARAQVTTWSHGPRSPDRATRRGQTARNKKLLSTAGGTVAFSWPASVIFNPAHDRPGDRHHGRPRRPPACRWRLYPDTLSPTLDTSAALRRQGIASRGEIPCRAHRRRVPPSARPFPSGRVLAPVIRIDSLGLRPDKSAAVESAFDESPTPASGSPHTLACGWPASDASRPSAARRPVSGRSLARTSSGSKPTRRAGPERRRRHLRSAGATPPPASGLDHIPPETLLVLDEPGDLAEAAEFLWRQADERRAEPRSSVATCRKELANRSYLGYTFDGEGEAPRRPDPRAPLQVGSHRRARRWPAEA